jgi:hypothetical protein
LTMVVLGLMVTVAGTVAALVLLELRFKVTPPAGAGLDRTRYSCCVAPPFTVKLAGEKNTVSAVTTVCVTVG